MRKIPDDISDRAIAFCILKAQREGQRLDRALSQQLPRAGPSGRGLVTELVNGVVRQTARLDHHLLFFCPKVSIPSLPMSGSSLDSHCTSSCF